MSILLDKQGTNILRNGDNPRLERRVQPRKILSLPYILSCLPTRRCDSGIHNRSRASHRRLFRIKNKRFRRNSFLDLWKKGQRRSSVRRSRLKRFAIDSLETEEFGRDLVGYVEELETVVKTFVKKEGKWVLCSPTTSSPRSIFRVRTVNARNRYRFLE